MQLSTQDPIFHDPLLLFADAIPMDNVVCWHKLLMRAPPSQVSWSPIE
jgi:hypothetical protein